MSLMLVQCFRLAAPSGVGDGQLFESLLFEYLAHLAKWWQFIKKNKSKNAIIDVCTIGI